MGDISLFNGVINQKQSPALYQGNFANRPAAGYLGRMFTSVDTGQIFVDTGSTWVLVADAGVGGGTLSSVCVNGNTTATGIVITAGGLNTNSLQVTSLNGAGGVLFSDGSGNITQDAVNFIWDNTNKYLGLGGSGVPTAVLDIHNSTAGVQIQINATSTNNSTIAFQNASAGKWRVGNLYSSGANLFHIYNVTNSNVAMQITSANDTTFNGSVTATSLIKSGGTSSQFLKADGSVDSSAYITLASLSATSPLIYNNATGAFSIQVANTSQSGYLSNTDWNTFNNKASLTSFSASSPLSYNSGTGAFSIQVANAGQNGYLTSTDWNTFNNKQNALTTGNLTETTSSVLTITGGTGAVIGTGTSIAVKQSSATQSGYLSSTDWNTFNNKAAALNGVGFVKANGTTISYDNSTYYLASNPNNYISLTSLAASSPLAYNNTTGGFSIQVATGTQNGYLSSGDWNTFNSKVGFSTISQNYIPYVSQILSGIPIISSSTIYQTSPSLLSIGSSVTATGSITSSVASGNGSIYFNNSSNSKFWTAIPVTNGTETDLQWYYGGTSAGTKITFANNGNVGIGTTSPDCQLVLNGSSNSRLNMRAGDIRYGTLYADAGLFAVSSETAIPLILGTNDIERARITSGGNVGIGTTSPQDKLDVNGSIRIRSNTPSFNAVLDNAVIDYVPTSVFPTTPQLRLYAVGTSSVSASIKLTVGNSAISYDAMYINGNNGNVLIGGTTTDNAQGTFQNPASAFLGGLQIGGLTFSTNTTATTGTTFYFFNGGAGVTLTLPDTNGKSSYYVIKNFSASPLTIGRTGTNTFIAIGSLVTVTSLTLASGASTIIIGNGTTNYVQII